MLLAFLQNLSYSMQSRAANRSNNLYHLIATIFATLIFFISLTYLITLKVTYEVLLTYILGTMLGSLYGVSLSAKVEKYLGAVANLGEEVRGQALPLSLATPVLLALLGLQLLLAETFSAQAVALIFLASFVSNVVFSALRAARSTNGYWLHLMLVIFHAAAGFMIFETLATTRGNWYLFAPYLMGTVLGSLLGAEWGKRLLKYAGAKWDVVALPKDVMPLPKWPVLVAMLLLIPHVFVLGAVDVSGQILIITSALLMTCAATVVSRARQRGHMIYLEWASIFSNGIWFVTLHILVVNSLPIHFLVPYIVGTAVGSLLGQAFAMWIEPRVGAYMEPVEKSI